MIKSRNFWIGMVYFAVITLLLIDIPEHYMDWQKEVREEIITVAQNVYTYSKDQKAKVLDRVFERNETLTFLIYIKAFLGLVLLGCSIFFFRRYNKEEGKRVWRAMLSGTVVIACLLSVKLFLSDRLTADSRIAFLPAADTDHSFRYIYDRNFKGSVVYIDFWGTTCGSCLQEFRDFTQALKDRYTSRKDIVFLYVSQGRRYLWKKQIKKYNVQGYHIFLDEARYDKLFRQLTQDSTGTIAMPRYLIVDKSGNIAVANARQPSDRDSLYSQLDKYLVQNN